MTLFEDTNAPYSDSNTTTLTEPQPATELQSEQPESSAHNQQDHGRQNRGQQGTVPQSDDPQNDAQQSQAQLGDEKPAPGATEDFASVLDSFTAETEEAAREDHVLKGTVLKLTATHVVVDIGAKS